MVLCNWAYHAWQGLHLAWGVWPRPGHLRELARHVSCLSVTASSCSIMKQTMQVRRLPRTSWTIAAQHSNKALCTAAAVVSNGMCMCTTSKQQSNCEEQCRQKATGLIRRHFTAFPLHHLACHPNPLTKLACRSTSPTFSCSLAGMQTSKCFFGCG